MDYEFVSLAVVDYLSRFKESLANLYLWELKKEKLDILVKRNLISSNDFIKIIQEKSEFSKNVELKKILNKNLITLNSSDKKELYFWIVKEWGGINLRNKEEFFEKVNTNKLNLEQFSKSKFDSIPSYSKVLSFIDIDNYFIYDSRVIYSLNWILFKSGYNGLLFPMPASRNSKLDSFNFDTIIKLYNKDKLSSISSNISEDKFNSKYEKLLYMNKNIAYDTYCKLIKKINSKLWDDDKQKYPFLTEMLLFSLADNAIVEDIINTCSVCITD